MLVKFCRCWLERSSTDLKGSLLNSTIDTTLYTLIHSIHFLKGAIQTRLNKYLYPNNTTIKTEASLKVNSHKLTLIWEAKIIITPEPVIVLT